MIELVQYITEKMWDTYQSHKYKDPIKSAIYDYVTGYTSGVNDDLRKGQKHPRGCKEVITNLDAAFESKYASKGLLDVYRTVEWDYMKNIYNCTKENIDTFVENQTVLQNKGYMSTTNELHSPWGSQWQDYELVLHITSDKPISYIDINKTFPNDKEIDCGFQKEYLLPRDIQLQLKSYSIGNHRKDKQFHKDGTYILELAVI